MKSILIQINKFKLIFDYLFFRIKFPGVKFIRVKKLIGTYFSQDGQDLFLSSILFDKLSTFTKSNIIIDIGANHPVKFSNSFFFEKYFQCKVIAIDPLVEFQLLWNQMRPNAEFINFAIGDKEDLLNIKIPVDGDNMFSSLEEGSIKKMHKGNFENRKVKVTTLNKILEMRNIKEVLFISIDVEGFELEVLKGIDFNNVNIGAFIIENNSKKSFGDDQIRKLLIKKGYVYYARIGWLDDVFVKSNFLKL